jgi:hypothetical protein
MEEQITALRGWARDRAQFASSLAAERANPTSTGSFKPKSRLDELLEDDD